MERAALYLRVSSEDQRRHGRSLVTQLAACQEYAMARGYMVTAVYQDVHTGADLLGRRGLASLRSVMRRGEVDVVVALVVDRLTRDLGHLHFLLVEAATAGTRFEFVLEELDHTPEGRLLRAVQGFAAEVERLHIAERTRRGVRAKIGPIP